MSRSRPKCLRALACSLGDMGPLAYRCTYRVGTAIDPLRGSTFHQRTERLLIQSHRDGHPRPLPDRRAARTRGRQLGQVIAALSLISPRLNLLIADGVSMKKTLTHKIIVYEILALHYRLHNGDSTRKPPSPRTRGRARHGARPLSDARPGRIPGLVAATAAGGPGRRTRSACRRSSALPSPSPRKSTGRTRSPRP